MRLETQPKNRSWSPRVIFSAPCCLLSYDVRQDLLEQSPLASQESFDALRRANDQLDEVGDAKGF